MPTSDLPRIQQAAKLGRLVYSGHALDEMDNANAQEADVEHAIRTATVAISQPGDRFRLEGGTDLDGTGLIVVVREIQPGLFIVTVF